MNLNMAASPHRASWLRVLYFICLLSFLSAPVLAEHTRRWRQSAYEEFLKGTAHGVAVRSDGRLELAPKFTLLADADASYLWSVRLDPKGTLYAAGGSPAKVFRFDSNGKAAAIFDSTDLSAQAIAFDSKGTLYVGTSPDGKGELFYSSDEAHIRVLAFDVKGNLVAGTEPSGRILRISRVDRPGSTHEKDAKSARKDSKESATAAAEGFVLYETSKREVTSLAVSSDGAIYVSAIGEKQRIGVPVPGAAISTPQGTTTVTTGGIISSGQAQPQQTFVPFPPLLSSSIYRISAEGRGVFAQLAKAGSSQITGIARNSSGKIFLCTANPGKVFSVGPEYEAEGRFESRSFDAQLFSQWGRLEWWSAPPAAAVKPSANSNEPRLEFFVRSGNTEDPGREWSRWYGPYAKSGSAMEAPPARFAQWKAVIHDGRPGDGIDWVSLAYLPRSVAPVIDGIALQEPGVRAQSLLVISSNQPAVVTLKMPPAPNISGVVITQSGPPSKFEQPPQGTAQKGYQTVVWTAHDENEDELRYAVYFRGENEREWKLLKDNLEQKFYSWDTTTMPDGAYYLKIAASDALSNPPALALKTERESERFEVDNTPPVIEDLRVGPPSGKMSDGHPVSFTARDAFSAIERAQYSLDGGEWILVAPNTGISDAPVEHYNFGFPALAPGEHTIAVRAYDRFENVGSAKTTFTVPAAKP